MINFNEFFIDDVQIIEKKSVPDGMGGREVREVGVGDMYLVFLDTPNSQEVFQANQIQGEEFDRYMYCTYDINFKRGQRIQHFIGGEVVAKYEVQGKPEDQGGRRQFYRIGLKEVS